MCCQLRFGLCESCVYIEDDLGVRFCFASECHRAVCCVRCRTIIYPVAWLSKTQNRRSNGNSSCTFLRLRDKKLFATGWPSVSIGLKKVVRCYYSAVCVHRQFWRPLHRVCFATVSCSSGNKMIASLINRHKKHVSRLLAIWIVQVAWLTTSVGQLEILNECAVNF